MGNRLNIPVVLEEVNPRSKHPGSRSSDRVGDELSSKDLVNLVVLRSRVAHARPISISATFIMDTWCIFTRACETGSKTGGVGGVLVSSNGRYIQHVGATLPQSWMDYFLKHSRHPIHEIGVLPLLISFMSGRILFPVLKSYTIPTTILAGTHS